VAVAGGCTLCVCFLDVRRHNRISPHTAATLSVFVALVTYIAVFHTLSNLPDGDLFDEIQSRFWMQPTAALALLLCPGVAAVSRWLGLHRGVVGVQASVLEVSVVVVVAAVQTSRWLALRSSPSLSLVDTFARGIIAPLPKNAVLLNSGDIFLMPLLYLQHCVKLREDVGVLNTAHLKGKWFSEQQYRHFPNVHFPDGSYCPECMETSSTFTIATLLHHNLPPRHSGGRRFFLNGYHNDSRAEDTSYQHHFHRRPFGILWEFVSKTENGEVSRQLAREVQAALPNAVEIRTFNESHSLMDGWEQMALTTMFKMLTVQNMYWIGEVRRLKEPPPPHLEELAFDLSQHLLANEPHNPILLRNDGALFQHLFNVGRPDRKCAYARRMVESYEGFIRNVDRTEEDQLRDVGALEEWCQRVRNNLHTLNCPPASTWTSKQTLYNPYLDG